MGLDEERMPLRSRLLNNPKWQVQYLQHVRTIAELLSWDNLGPRVAQMRELIEQGHLYLGVPPLYKLSQGGKTAYARDDAHKDELLRSVFTGRGKMDISRFKGLGEMMPAQLKETTMDPKKRTLLKVEIAGEPVQTDGVVEQLMGNKPEGRFRFIQERAEFAHDLDI